MKRRIIIGCSLLLALLATIYGYREYTRQRQDTKQERPAFVIQAPSWLNEFATDANAASRKYAGRELFVQVEGMVKSTVRGENNHTVILLGDATGNSSVRCLMDSVYQSEVEDIRAGQTITIKGQFTGYKADELGIGADIEMNFCVLVNKKP